MADYDSKYLQHEYFRYKPLVYRPFVKALLDKAGLKKGSSILDAGCGQGYFTGAFAELGLKATGVDISAAGIESAKATYEKTGATFEIGNVLSLPYENTFDCVFARGCSLYNSREIENRREVSKIFLSYLKERTGWLIFDYHTNFCARKHSETWIYHSMATIKKHFSDHANAEIYFSLKVETLFLGKCAFSTPMTVINSWLSRRLGVGGELIAFVRKD